MKAFADSGFLDLSLLQKFIATDRVFGMKYSPRALFQYARAQAAAGKMNTAISASSEALAGAWTMHRPAMEKATFRAEIEDLTRSLSRQLSSLFVCSGTRSLVSPGDDDELRVGWLSSQLADASPSADLLTAMSQGAGRCTLTHVFTTESRTTRHSNVPGICSLRKSSDTAGQQTHGRLSMGGVEMLIGSGSQKPALDTIDLAQAIAAAELDVLITDAPMSDMIASVVMSLVPVPLKLSICRSSPMVSGGVHRVIDMSHRNIAGVWSNRKVTSVAQGLSPRSAMPLDRSRLGLSSKASIVVSRVGENIEAVSPHFVGSVRTILRNNPRVVMVFLCDRRIASVIRQRVGRDQLAARVYLAHDEATFDSLTRASDVYLASFPQFDPGGVLAALEMSLPVCAIGSQAGSSCLALEQLLGLANVVQTPEAYAKRAGDWVSDANLRWKDASQIRSRLTRYASIDHTASEIAELTAQEYAVQVNRAIASGRRVPPQRKLAVA